MENINATNEVIDDVVETEAVEAAADKKDIIRSIPKPVKFVVLTLLALAGAGLGYAFVQHGKGNGYTDLNWKPLDDIAPVADSKDFAEAE